MLKKIPPFIFILFFLPATLISQESKGVVFHMERGYSFMTTNKDSTYFYYNKALEIAKRMGSLERELNALYYLVYANGIFFDLINYKNNLEKMEEVLSCNPFPNKPDYTRYYWKNYLFYKGNYYYKTNQFNKAQTVFKNLLEYGSKNNDAVESRIFLKSSLSFLAASYYNTGKLSLAEDYYKKALNLYQEQRPLNWQSNVAVMNLSLADVYRKRGQLKKSEALIEKAILFYETDDYGMTRKNAYFSAYFSLVKNHLKQGFPKKALTVLQKIADKKLILPENLKFQITALKYKARALVQLENYEKAMNLYTHALILSKKQYDVAFHPEIAEIHMEMAELRIEQGQHENSLNYFQKALSSLSEDFESKNEFDNPDPEKITSKTLLVEILSKKISALVETHNAKKNQDQPKVYLKTALKTGKSLTKTLELLKPEFESKIDRQFMLENTFPAFHKMVAAAYFLYQKTGKHQYLEDAFYFSEKSRAVSLLSAVQNTGVEKFADVPEEVLEKENQYQAKINHLEKQLFENPKDSLLPEKLFELKKGFYSFLNEIEKKYPKYHNLKYQTRIVSLEKLREILPDETAMLYYYLSDKYLYRFTIEKEKVGFSRIPFSKKDAQEILGLRELLSRPGISSKEKPNEISDVIRKKLIPKKLEADNLVIAPSGVLNYIPFEALFNKETTGFLIEDYAVSYAQSATLYKEFSEKKNMAENVRLLSFAPDFSQETNTETNFSPLPFNKEEVLEIAQYFDGETLTGNKASLNVFQETASDYGILHFATHAALNDKHPDYSFLVFAPQDSLPGLLYIKDLYNYKLNAELVVLSACETGVGKLQKGVGMRSLAQGFNYAGAHSLLTTMWKINDKSALGLMDGFYKNLAKGKPKQEALRLAKLDYLKNTDDPMQRHPYFWAGFVLTGNTTPIVGTTNWWLWAILGIGIVVLGLIIYKKKKGKKV